MRPATPPARLLLLAVALFLGAAASALSQQPEPRLALVMGVGDYRGTKFQTLPGIDKDLQRMRDALKTAGFQVTVLENPSLSAAEEAIETFGAKLKAQAGGVGLFYFSGHGGEFEGKNYLIPKGARIGGIRDIREQAVAAQRVLNRMEDAGARVNLVFLDCCRNDLTKAATATGLATMTAKGTFIGFATGTDKTSAASAEGSPYTTFLAQRLLTPGVSVLDMHTQVTADVEDFTRTEGAEQTPFQYSGLRSSFFFVPSGGASLVTSQPAASVSVIGQANQTKNQTVLKPNPRISTRFNADPSNAGREKGRLIFGVKSYVKPSSNARPGSELGLDFKFASVDTPAKLVFRAQNPDYPLIISVRFPETGRFCDLPEQFFQEVKKLTGIDANDFPDDWRIQATMYDFDDDGNPELVVALNKWDQKADHWDAAMALQVLVYSFRPPGLEEDLSRVENWKYAGSVSGQFVVRLNNDEVELPYGSQGLYDNYIYRSGYLVEGGNLAINKNVTAVPEPSAKERTSVTLPENNRSSPGSTLLEAKLRQLAREYIQSASSDSLEREVAMYAEKVDYYGEGIKTNAYIREDTKRQRIKADRRTFEVLTIHEATVDASTDQGRVILEYRYAIVRSGKRSEGTAITRIIFRSLSQQPKVIAVSEVKGK